jgi:uncharacterized protein (DUF58 family)
LVYAQIVSRRLTLLGLLLGLAGLLLEAWGLLLEDWKLIEIGLAFLFVLAGSVILAYISVNILINNLLREISQIPLEGHGVTVSLRVDNSKALFPVFADIVDSPPPGIRYIGDPQSRALIPPATYSSLNYFIVARAGKREFGPVRARVVDPLGLYRVEVEWSPKGDKYLYSRPRVERSRVEETVEKEVSTLVRKLTPGLGLEFYEVREYQEGDDPRLIDWKATARLGKLIVKEMRKESSSPAILILIPGPNGDRGSPYKTVFERESRIAAGIAQDLTSKGVLVGYLALVEQPIMVPPATTAKGLNGVLSGIAHTPPQNFLPAGISGIIRKYLYDYVRARPLLILILPKSLITRVYNDIIEVANEVMGKVIVVGVSDEG